MAQRYTIESTGTIKYIGDDKGMWVTAEAYILMKRQLVETMRRLEVSDKLLSDLRDIHFGIIKS